MEWSWWRTGRRVGQGCLTTFATRLGVLAVLVLGLNAIVPAWRALWFSASGTVVDAVVVRQREVLEGQWNSGPRAPGAEGPEMGSARRVFRAVLEFRDGEQIHHVEARTAGHVVIYPDGSRVPVVYPPGQPERAQLRPELPDMWLQAAWLLVGTFLVGWGVYWWWTMARRPRRARVVKAAK